MRKIAILQSNYIPWKGYFDMINSVDEFVLYDDVQFTKRDWRNRNIIKTSQGLKWLSIPCQTKNNQLQLINETVISDKKWAKKHLTTLKLNYSKSPYFRIYEPLLDELYLGKEYDKISDVNYTFITAINKVLGIETKISRSEDYCSHGVKSDRLLDICKKANATTYLSGPAAKCYLDESLFNAENISVEWMDYSGYNEYQQLYGDFEHGVTILDLLFNEGPNAHKYMKSFNCSL